jgi:hypothetical protein
MEKLSPKSRSETNQQTPVANASLTAAVIGEVESAKGTLPVMLIKVTVRADVRAAR